MAEKNIGMRKTYKESFFKIFKLDSLTGDYLLKAYNIDKNDVSKIRSYNEHVYDDLDVRDNPAVVLQIMLCDDNFAIAEIISKSDLKKYDSNQDRDERQLLIDDINIAIKLLRNPYIDVMDIRNYGISLLVKYIIDDTPINHLDEIVVKIANLLTYWGKIVARGEEVPAVRDDTGLFVSDMSGLLMVSRVILSKLEEIRYELDDIESSEMASGLKRTKENPI